MNRYPRYRVRITQPDGIHLITGWGEFNSRHCYRKWCERVGTDVYRAELIGVDAAGVEHIVQHCELRTDLYAKVKPEPVEQAKQMVLL